MVGVFALFGTLSSLELKQAGVGLAAAVLIDATVDPRRAPARDDEAARRVELVPAAQPQLAAQARARAARDARASAAVARLDPLTGLGTAAHIQPTTHEGD